MRRKFKPYPINEPLLIPPDLNDWLPENHLARFVGEVITEQDVVEWHSTYESGGGRGQPPYPPVMMVRILLYCYCTGRFSARKIAQATYDDLGVRYLAADTHPNYSRISEFARRHESRLIILFRRVVRLARELGMVTLGHVAIDGTKLRANAARRKTIDADSLRKQIEADEALVRSLLERGRRADEADEEADTTLPEELATVQARLDKLRLAMAKLDQDAAEQAAREEAAQEARGPREPVISAGENSIAELRRKRGWTQTELGAQLGFSRGLIYKLETLRMCPSQALLEKVAEKFGVTPESLRVLLKRPRKPKRKRRTADQRPKRVNITDPHSAIMKPSDHKSTIQGYNGQLAVDSKCQIIVAAGVTSDTTDYASLKPMLEAVHENCEAMPTQLSADAGYCSEKNLTDPTISALDIYIATGKRKDLGSEGPPEGLPARRAMREKLSDPGARAIYDQRGAIVEPVNARIKNCLGFTRFSRRGLPSVKAEWLLVSTCHNLLKIFRYLSR